MYSDALNNGRREYRDKAAEPPTGDTNNSKQDQNNSNNNNNGHSGFLKDIKDIFAFLQTMNFSHALTVIKDTFQKMKNEEDTFTKVAIFIEGIFDIFP